MGKMNALLTQATAAIPPATPPPEAWGHETPATEEPPPAQATATLDEVLEAATQAARETEMETPAPTELPAPREPEPPVLRVVEPPVLRVVEPTPLIRAVERLHQGVQVELRAVKAEVQGAASVARRQEDYLREVQRAHNTMATEWYQIAEGLPAIRGELERLAADLAAVRRTADEETRETITLQGREIARTLRQVRTAALGAVVLVALVSLLAVVLVAALALHGLHRPL
jgi:hypothetical protein